MTTNKEINFIKTVATLIVLTRTYKIVWYLRRNFRDNSNISECYIAKIDDIKLALYKNNTKSENKSVQVKLEVIDNNNNCLVSFPGTEIVNDLANAINFQYFKDTKIKYINDKSFPTLKKEQNIYFNKMYKTVNAYSNKVFAIKNTNILSNIENIIVNMFHKNKINF